MGGGDAVARTILLIAIGCISVVPNRAVEPDDILAEDQSELTWPEWVAELRVSEPEMETLQLAVSDDDDSLRRGTDTNGTLTLSDYDGNASCYNRDTSSFWAVVDSHLHFRPFGGSAVRTKTTLDWLRDSGILFSSMYGIGQRFPVSSDCVYYLEDGCTNETITPSIKDDVHNGDSYAEHDETSTERLKLFPSMAFPDLSDPDTIYPQIKLLDKEFPNVFSFAGEANVVKQAIFENGQGPVTKDEIDNWADFMAVLRDRAIPLMLHSDLGNNTNNTEYLDLMDRIVGDYPDNLICWLHLGLSRELTTFEGGAEEHVAILEGVLNKSSNLYFDLAWSVLWDDHFSNETQRGVYVQFINKWSHRIIPGTDQVLSRNTTGDNTHVRTLGDYQADLNTTSLIYQYVDDRAFRNIALGQTYLDLLGSNYTAPEICDQ